MADREDVEARGSDGCGGEEEKLLQGVTVLDFDVLCSTVAQGGKWKKVADGEEDDHVVELGGVFRMWEGDLLDLLDDRRVAAQSAWYIYIF